MFAAADLRAATNFNRLIWMKCSSLVSNLVLTEKLHLCDHLTLSSGKLMGQGSPLLIDSSQSFTDHLGGLKDRESLDPKCQTHVLQGPDLT